MSAINGLEWLRSDISDIKSQLKELRTLVDRNYVRKEALVPLIENIDETKKDIAAMKVAVRSDIDKVKTIVVTFEDRYLDHETFKLYKWLLFFCLAAIFGMFAALFVNEAGIKLAERVIGIVL